MEITLMEKRKCIRCKYFYIDELVKYIICIINLKPRIQIFPKLKIRCGGFEK